MSYGGGIVEKIQVLVVEDEAMIHEVIGAALEDGGFAVVIAMSGEEAVAALEDPAADYRVLITDIRLRRDGITGWDVARRARELNPSAPVVYMTGDSSADWAAQGVPNSILLSKPFAPAQAVTAVAQLLNALEPPSGVGP
jgi:CheY-like chemotaxis protein